MDLRENNSEIDITHWYYAHKYSAIKRLIEQELFGSDRVIDVGAGSAIFSLQLLKDFPNLSCTAVDTGYSEEFLNKPQTSNRMKYSKIFQDNNADIYLLTDVLEHIEHPIAFLTEYVAKSRDGAKFVISVPALQSLWSGHDVFLKHYKRYNKKELATLMKESGLKINRVHYLYTFLYPLALIARNLPTYKEPKSYLKAYPSFLHKIIIFPLRADFFFSRFLNFGISLIAYGEKEKSHPKLNNLPI
jgi:2-polyprenyl-3-methyl-5-hydroxy-6-metoxy-1,4-benzoquinol methylase